MTTTDPPELLAAHDPRVWIAWYFKRGLWCLVTVPLFGFFVYALVVSLFGAFIQGFALARATRAVWGVLGVLLMIFGGWIPVILPPVLYYSLLKNLPGLWIRPDASRKAKIIGSAGVLIAIPLVASLAYNGLALGIGWIADRDPCAALRAGVTGSIAPANCQ